jgi:hypothetical protein
MPEACDLALRQLSDLLAGDAAESAALDRHLSACDACYRQAVKLFRQDRAFSQMAARARPLAISLPRRRRWVLPVFAAAAALLIGGFFLVFHRDGDIILEVATGEVFGAGVGDAIRPGQTVETGGGGRAVLRFGDQSRVELAEKAVVAAQEGKRLRIDRGAISATVTPQSQAMVFETKAGEARVLGTSLRIVVDPDFPQMRLEVTEGKVRLLRWADQKTVDVPAGHFAVAAEGVDLALRPLASGKSPSDLLQLDYSVLRGMLQLRAKTWATLPWVVSLSEAREKAAREGKPIFMIQASGHPLGYVGTNAVIARENVLNDPEIAKIIAEKFVPLALDNQVVPNMSVEERAWLQQFDSGLSTDTYGLGAFTADGKKLATGQIYELPQMRRFLDVALKTFRPGTDPIPPLAGSAPQLPPEGGALVRVTWKAFFDDPEPRGPASSGKYEKRFQESLGSDRLWIRKDEVTLLAQGIFPATLKSRMLRFNFNVLLTGNLKWMDVTMAEGRIRGAARAEDGRQMALQGLVAVKDGKLVRFELLARGEGSRSAQDGFKASLTVAPSGRRVPTAVLFELADPADPLDRIAPHGARQSGYLR